jgi:UDP-N-acetyl-D-glucosamine dehydrogenase
MVETPAAGQLFHLPDPAAEPWDLVVVHTVHPAQDHRWLSSQPAVLDTTYRVKDVPSRHAL